MFCSAGASVVPTSPGATSKYLPQKRSANSYYTLPDETIVYTGHGPETTIGDEKKNNPFVKA